ncbi:hypothetical protein HYD89_03440 [Mycoplasmopsis bovis]|nr:hypothetical protein [Mycoplasmopsis bovis]QQH36246.1 hypothetical protein HYD89_03440 [Mycoplasmopsis bovis]
MLKNNLNVKVGTNCYTKRPIMMNLDLEAGKNDNDNSDSRTKGNTARNA